MNIHLDFFGSFKDKKVRELMYELAKHSESITELGVAKAPWFPTQIEDFDYIGKRILSSGDGIQESDHVGFTDPEYRARRDFISKIALDYKVSEKIPEVVYTE